MLLKISRKKNLIVYISDDEIPNESEYDIALGDLESSKLDDAFIRYKMKELLQAETPFEYDRDSDSILYHTNFDHCGKDAFSRENYEKFKGRNLSKLTTWKPNFQIQREIYVQEGFVLDDEDRIDLLLDASLRFQDDKRKIKTMYINVVNCDPDKEEQEVDV